MSKIIGVKFILEGGAWLSSPMTELEARQIIQGWVQGKLNPYIAGTSPSGDWAVRTESIRAIHTYDPLEMERLQNQQQLQQVPGAVRQGWNKGLSGI